MQAHTEAQAVPASAGRHRKERGLLGPAWRVARKEVTDLYRDGRIIWAMAAVALLIMSSIALSWQDFRSREAERTQADTTVRHQWENQGAKNPHSAAHFGQYVFTPESVPAAIDPGTLAHTGSAVWLEPHRRNLFRFHPAEDQTAAVRYGPLTPALLLQVVVPLLIVSFCFASVAGEREAGTLRLLLSLGLTRGQLFLGKALGVALAGAPLAVLLFAPVAVLGLAQTGQGADGTDQVLRLLLMALVYCAYWSVWVLVGLGVSSRAATAQRTLIVLLALWALATLLAPRVGSFLSEQIARPPSTPAFVDGIQSDLAHGLDGKSPAETRYQELVEQTLKEYNVKRLQELPVGFGGLRRRSQDAYSERVHDKHFDALHDTWRRQARLHLLVSAVSPLIPAQALSQGLAGTDVEHHIHFSQAAERYRRYFVDFTTDALTAGEQGTEKRMTAGNEMWQSIKAFDYQRPTAGEALRAQWPGLLVLAAWLVASAWYAYRSFRRLNFE